MIKPKILYLYLIWIEGFPPKRKVVARLLSGMSFFLSFNRIFNGFWRVNDKRDLSDVFITPKKKTINATITIRMIEIIASHNISPSSPICNFILHLKDVVILLCLVILFGIYSQIFDCCL